MCGRYDQTASIKKLEEVLKKESEKNFSSTISYNVTPTSMMPVVTMDNPGHLKSYHWGLIPSFSEEFRLTMSTINARADKLMDSRMWSKLLLGKRCLIPATGFIEWDQDPGRKAPFRFQLKDQEIFYMGGLFELWIGRDDNEVKGSFTIITTEANALMEKYHSRMPLIISSENEKEWLNPALTTTQLFDELITPYPAEEMTCYPVHPLIGKASNNYPELLEEYKSYGIQGTLF